MSLAELNALTIVGLIALAWALLDRYEWHGCHKIPVVFWYNFKLTFLFKIQCRRAIQYLSIRFLYYSWSNGCFIAWTICLLLFAHLTVQINTHLDVLSFPCSATLAVGTHCTLPTEKKNWMYTLAFVCQFRGDEGMKTTLGSCFHGQKEDLVRP